MTHSKKHPTAPHRPHRPVEPQVREENPSSTQLLQIGYFALGLGGLIISAIGLRRAMAADRQRQDRWLEPGDHFLLLGDSIGVGLQAPLGDLSNAYGSVMTSLVQSGTTVAYWAKHVDESDGGFKCVVLTLGTNDVVGDPENEAHAMDQLVATLGARGAPVLWAPPPSFREGGYTERQRTFANMLTERGVITLVLRGPQPSVASDPMHAHPDGAGYRTMASQIFQALTNDLLPRGRLAHVEAGRRFGRCGIESAANDLPGVIVHVDDARRASDQQVCL